MRDFERRVRGAGRRRVLEPQRERHAGTAPCREVGRHAQVDADGIERGRAARAPAAAAASRSARPASSGDRCARTRARRKRRAVALSSTRFTCIAAPGHRRPAEHERFGRDLELVAVAAHDHEELRAPIGRIGHHAKLRAGRRRQRREEGGRSALVTNAIAWPAGWVSSSPGSACRASARAPEPRGDDRARAQRRHRGLRSEDERDRHAPLVALVEEGLGQDREVVGDGERLHRDLQLAGAAHVRPEPGARASAAEPPLAATKLSASLLKPTMRRGSTRCRARRLAGLSAATGSSPIASSFNVTRMCETPGESAGD